jgi:hypothetical protein
MGTKFDTKRLTLVDKNKRHQAQLAELQAEGWAVQSAVPAQTMFGRSKGFTTYVLVRARG